jgi:hypothetical protein
MRHNAQPLPQHSKILRRVRYNHYRLLNRRARNIRRSRYQRRGVHLSRAGDAEERGSGERVPRGPEESEVGEVFCRSIHRKKHPLAPFLAPLPSEEEVEATYACAPSLSAMKGRSGHSLSTAGSLPSSAPNQDSTSGPLLSSVGIWKGGEVAYRAWWNPTTVTRGTKPLEVDSLFAITSSARRPIPRNGPGEDSNQDRNSMRALPQRIVQLPSPVDDCICMRSSYGSQLLGSKDNCGSLNSTSTRVINSALKTHDKSSTWCSPLYGLMEFAIHTASLDIYWTGTGLLLTALQTQGQRIFDSAANQHRDSR